MLDELNTWSDYNENLMIDISYLFEALEKRMTEQLLHSGRRFCSGWWVPAGSARFLFLNNSVFSNFYKKYRVLPKKTCRVFQKWRWNKVINRSCSTFILKSCIRRSSFNRILSIIIFPLCELPYTSDVIHTTKTFACSTEPVLRKVYSLVETSIVERSSISSKNKPLQ